MSLTTDVSRALKWSAAGVLATQAINWAITLVVVRLLAPQDYGLMALAAGFTTFMVLVGELGLGAALVQAKELGDRQIRAVAGMVVLTNAALALALLALAPALAWFFGEQRLVPILSVLSLNFLLMAAGVVPQALLVRALDFRRKSLLEAGAQLLGGVLALCLAYAGLGVWALVLASLGATAAKSGGMWLAAPKRCWPGLDFRPAWGMAGFGGLVVAQRMVWWLHNQADVLVIAKLYSAAVLGPYAVAMHLATLPQQKISAVIIQVASSGFSRIQTDRTLVRSYLAKALKFLAMLSFPVCFGVSCVAPELVALALGPNWAAAALPLQLLSLVVPLRMIATPVHETLNALGKPRTALANAATTTAIVLAGILAGAPHGILGVCSAWLLGFPLALALNVHRAGRHTAFTLADLAASCWRPFAAALAMYAAVAASRAGLPADLGLAARLACLVAAGAATYLAAMLALDRRGCVELLAFSGLLRARASSGPAPAAAPRPSLGSPSGAV